MFNIIKVESTGETKYFTGDILNGEPKWSSNLADAMPYSSKREAKLNIKQLNLRDADIERN